MQLQVNLIDHRAPEESENMLFCWLEPALASPVAVAGQIQQIKSHSIQRERGFRLRPWQDTFLLSRSECRSSENFKWNLCEL